MPARLTITVPDSVMADVEAQKPRSLSLAAFCALLIEQGLTASATLVERRGDTPGRVDPLSEASSSKAVTSSSLITSNKERDAVKSRKRTEVTPEFQEWWRLYLSTPLAKRVPSQTKPKAWAAWQRAVKDYTPEQLMAATQEAIRQVKAMAGDYRMPDAARWLSEARYEALIDATAPAQGLEAETYEETQRRIFGHHA